MKEPGKSKNASVQTLTFSQRLLVLVLVGLTLAVVFGAVVGGADSSEVAHMHALATRDALDWGGAMTVLSLPAQGAATVYKRLAILL